MKCRRPEYSIKEHIIFESAFQNYLACENLPAFPPLKTKEGKSFIILKDRVYQLYPFIEGSKFCQDNLNQLTEVAEILSRFHSAGISFLPPVSKKLPRYDDPKVMRKKLEEIITAAKGKEKKEIATLINFTPKIEEKLPDSLYRSLPNACIQGDFHPVNLKFKRNKVVGIFDFDWCSLQPRLRDVADGILFFASLKKKDYQSDDIISLTQPVVFNQKRTELFLHYYEKGVKLSSLERELLPCFINARWLNCRVDGMRKIPREKRISFLLKDIFGPLNSLKECSFK